MTGAELRAIRTSRNWSQTDLADYVGDTTTSTVSRWEKDVIAIPAWVVDKLLSSVTLAMPINELAELLQHTTAQKQSFPDILAEAVREYLIARKSGKIVPLYAQLDGSEPDTTARAMQPPPIVPPTTFWIRDATA